MFFASTIFNEKICIIQISKSILALQELEEIIFAQNVKSIKGEYIYTHFLHWNAKIILLFSFSENTEKKYMIQFTIDEIKEQKREPLQKQYKMELVYTILSNKEMKLIPICKGRLKEMLLKLHF